MGDLDKLRTNLANERTLLAYIRTALALLIFGMAAVKFFPGSVFISSIGWLFMAFGIMTLIWGIRHFYRTAKLIK